MQCAFGVLVLASLCLAGPEADPALLLTHPADAHPLPLLTHPAPFLTHPAPLLTHPAPLLTHPTPFLTHPTPLLTHPAPLLHALPVAHPVANHPVIKSVVEVPAEVTHQVVAHPFFHHAPIFHHASPIVHHAAPVVHHVDPVALSTGAVHQVTPFLNLGRKKREAEAEAEADAEAEAEAEADAYYYSSVSTPYASYGSFVPDALPHLPLVAHVDAPVHHGHSHFGHYGLPYGGFFGGYRGFPYHY